MAIAEKFPWVNGLKSYCFLVLAAASCCRLALAQVAGLVSIPVADTIGVRELELGYGIAGSQYSRSYGHSAYVLAGVHERFEIAAATDFLGSTVGGFKFSPYSDSEDRFRIAVGAQNVAAGSADWFAVGRFSAKEVNLHFGWLEDGTNRLCLGIDTTCCQDQLTLGLDHTTGADGSTWFGAFYSIGSGMTVNANLGYPNNRVDGLQYSFSLIYGTRF